MKEQDSSKIGAETPSFMHSVEKKYRVTWRENRSHELYVGGTMIGFAPHGSHVVGENIVNHPDFQRVRRNFVVKEE